MIPKGTAKRAASLQARYTPLDNRHAERVFIGCRLMYRGEVSTHRHEGQGITKDISISGCKVVSESPVTRGTLLTLSIALPDGDRPLVLQSAHVVWVSGCHFSVRFLRLNQEERKRLQAFILKHISHDSISDRRARFRLV